MPNRPPTLSLILTLSLSLSLSLPAFQSSAPVLDPVPDAPIPSGLALQVETFAVFPKSQPIPEPTDPRLMRTARINYLGELPDGSGRMFVPDINGALYLVTRGKPSVYIDVGKTFAPDFFSGRGLGQGFAFVAFDPEFARNGRFYTVHTETGDALTTKTTDLRSQAKTLYHGIITEWTADDPKAPVFHGTRRELLRLGFGGQIHGIQQVEFDPNARTGDPDYGLLYVTVGEGGIGQATGNTDAQDLAMPFGKILRIDPAGRNSRNGKYGIPASNPFVGRNGALGEIYAVGMRDPHRISWDTGGSHRLFLGHIGEHQVESIYDVHAGDNFGWSEREASWVFNKAERCHLYTLPPNDSQLGYTYPVAAYAHHPPADWPCTKDSGHAVSGGFVYRGRLAPELTDKYVFGDIVDGRLFYTDESEMKRGGKLAPLHLLLITDTSGRTMTMQELAGDTRVDLHFGHDHAGELYLLSKANGTIWKVTGVKKAK